MEKIIPTFEEALQTINKIFSNDSISLEKRKYEADEFILTLKEKDKNIYHIDKGLLSFSFPMEKHRQNICALFYPNDIIVTPSFLDDTQPEFNILALQKTSLTTISKSEFKKLYEQDVRILLCAERIARKMLIKFATNTIRSKYQAEIRYEECVQNENISVLLSINRRYLASYLGMSTKTLQRILNKR
jgi:CRP-like cAMP-binding protein